jgi:hypothetical protein
MFRSLAPKYFKKLKYKPTDFVALSGSADDMMQSTISTWSNIIKLFCP